MNNLTREQEFQLRLTTDLLKDAVRKMEEIFGITDAVPVTLPLVQAIDQITARRQKGAA